MRIAALIVVLSGMGALPGVVFGETAVGLVAPETLVTFDTATPAGAATHLITGLVGAAGETLIGIDLRPATGRLFALSVDTANVTRTYSLDTDTTAATFVGQASTPTLTNAALYGMDFNGRPRPTAASCRAWGRSASRSTAGATPASTSR